MDEGQEEVGRKVRGWFEPGLHSIRRVSPKGPDCAVELCVALLEIAALARRLTPNDLRIFEAIVRHGGIRGASEELYPDRPHSRTYLYHRVERSRGLLGQSLVGRIKLSKSQRKRD